MSKTATYAKIASYTIPSSQSSYEFTSIPGTYTDLIITTNGTGSSNASFKLQFNGDTNANYSVTYMYGDGGSTLCSRAPNYNDIPAMGRLGTSQGNSTIHIMNYSNSTLLKTVFGRGSLTSQLSIAAVGLWRSTAAITSVKLTPEAGTISAGSIFTLYGIEDAK
jgi:hypothetical protein